MRCAGSNGFTIVEVVVAAVVLSIVALIGIIQIRSLSPAQTLENGSDDFRSFLVLARSYAQTGHVCCSDQLPNGYGVVFTMNGTPDNTATLYADFDGSHAYTAGSTDQILNTLVLPRGLNFTQCAASAATLTTGDCDIFFSVAAVSNLYVNGTAETALAAIAIQHTATATSTTVTVNSFGVIE